MRDEIIINGVKYDAITGENLGAVNVENESFGSNQIHQTIQKSQTLNRKFVRRPENLSREQLHAIEQFKRRHDYLEARKSSLVQSGRDSRSQISHFEGIRGSASRSISPITVSPVPQKTAPKALDDVAPVQNHPIHQKALDEIRKQKAEKVLPSSQAIKQSAISEAFEKSREDDKKSKKSRGIRKRRVFARRFAGIFAGFAVVFLAAGYLTYLNLPNISTRIAAVQGGINASLPQYVAQGYQLNGLAYFDGESVNLNYSNGKNSYTLKQSESAWDSVALLENYVEKTWNSKYSTYQEKGLTIYKNEENQAVWINDGKLYAIESQENLSGEEIRKIATSF